jgi:hypothetical protein
MKVCFRLLLLFLLLPALAPGQPISDYGFKAAATSSGLVSDKLPDISLRSGLCLASFIEAFRTSYFALQVQLEYNQRGFVEEQVETTETGQIVQKVLANTRLDYISLPVLVMFYPFGPAYPHYTLLGPRIDYLAHRRNGVFKFTQVDHESRLADDFADFVVGASFGVGLTYPGPFGLRISMELRYNGDFTDSYADIKTLAVRNHSMDIWLGFSLAPTSPSP